MDNIEIYFFIFAILFTAVVVAFFYKFVKKQ